MFNTRRYASILIVVIVVASAVLLDALAPVDEALRALRFSHASRPASGDIVFLEIDSESIDQVGVWPWPRSVHAAVIDQLLALDASDIVFDVDFSTPSSEAEDAEFARALEDAGGYVTLAAFYERVQGRAEGALNLPLPRFRAHADPVMVNVLVDRDGVLRRYPYGVEVSGQVYPSLAVWLSNFPSVSSDHLIIDYGIDAGSVDHFSVAQLLRGEISPDRVQGRQVVVGASALELRDTYTVPRYGIMPGALVQILATETLAQGRRLTEAGPAPVLTLVAAIGVFFALVSLRLPLLAQVAVAVLASICLELAAYLLQKHHGILINSTAVHAAQVGFFLASLLSELNLKKLLLHRTAWERDATRDILDRVITDNFDGVVVVDDKLNVVAASRLAEVFLGQDSATPISGMHAGDLLPLDIMGEIVLAMETKGSTRPVRSKETTISGARGVQYTIEYVVTLSRLDDAPDSPEGKGPAAVACLTFRDITERRENERQLEYLVSRDQLTGALSRHRFVETLNKVLEDEVQRREGVTVIMADLSRFKAVNDTLGHSFGDAVLKQVVSRLRACEAAEIARISGDCFAVMRKGIMDEAETRHYCEVVLERLGDSYTLGENQAIVGARLGVTDSARSGYDAELLLAHADMALSAARDRPGSGFVFYRSELDERLREKQEIETCLRHAIGHGQLSLVFQPQVLLEGGELVGVEALVRWKHPKLGVVPPSVFIPVAEETGLIIDVGRWVLEAACREVASWPGNCKVAVNVSPMQFEFSDIAEEVRRALELSGLPAARLEVEITESLFIADLEMVTDALVALQEIGVGIALDDFGTGYASLGYLAKLPIDKIKIDRSFVDGLPDDEQQSAIIRAVMTLTTALGKTVVAEGVETADQVWMLRQMGCRVGQGYYFSRPISASEIRALLDNDAGYLEKMQAIG